MTDTFWNTAGGTGQLIHNSIGNGAPAPHTATPGGMSGTIGNEPTAAQQAQMDSLLATRASLTEQLATAKVTAIDTQVQVDAATADVDAKQVAYNDALAAYQSVPNSANFAAVLNAQTELTTAANTLANANLNNATAQSDIASYETQLNTNAASIAALEATLEAAGVHLVTVYSRSVNPHYDGTNNALPTADRPTDFTSTAPSTFASWHSAYQAEWLATTGNGAGAITTLTLSGVSVPYLLSSDGKTVVPVYNLDATEVGKLSTADQQALTNNATVWADLQSRLAVSKTTTGGGTTVSSAYSEIQAGAATMGDDYLVFLQQMDLLIERNDNSAIVNQDVLDEKAAEILDRFNRALQFASAPNQVNIHFLLFGAENGSLRREQVSTSGSYNTYSSDNGATVSDGYGEFMRAERAVLASKMARAAIAPVGGGFNDPRLDVPNLIFRLQSLYEIESDAIEDGGTEELVQLYALLDDYAIMQAMVNETIKAYDVSNTDQKRRFMNVDGTADRDNNDLKDYIDKNLENDGIDNDGQRNDSDNDDIDSIGYSTSGSVGHIYYMENDTNKFSNQNWWYGLPADVSAWAGVKAGIEANGDSLNWHSEGVLSTEQMRIFSMFASDPFTNSEDADHPLEALYGIDRPLQRMTDHDDDEHIGGLARYEKSTWDTFSTQLSDSVTQLNQQVQILQNEVSDATKQKNRHFELGNNALGKMYDIIGQIANM